MKTLPTMFSFTVRCGSMHVWAFQDASCISVSIKSDIPEESIKSLDYIAEYVLKFTNFILAKLRFLKYLC